MPDRSLPATLRAFAEEATWTLAAENVEGHELSFEVIDEGAGRGRPPLYCYRADTTGFIAEHAHDLARLETWLPAVHRLAGRPGLDGYLRSRGHARVPADGRERAEAALRAFLERLYEDASEFVLSEERLARATDELELLLTAGRTDVEVVVPVLGLELESDAVPLTDGLAMVRPETLDRVPEEAAWDGERASTLLRVAGVDESIAAEAAVRARRVITALRLYDDVRVALGPAAWIRTAGGPWQVVATGSAGTPDGVLTVAADQEDELRAFCNLVWRRLPRAGILAWALQRYELGCERPPSQRITDHLIALRALLEPEGPDSFRLADRVAALCADEADRGTVADHVDHAMSLERSIVAGRGAAPGATALANELTGHLRAILRDVLCGHLDSDVCRLADELIAAPASVSETFEE